MRASVLLLASLLCPVIAEAQPLALGARVEREGVSVAFLAGHEVVDVATSSWRATVQGVGAQEVVVRVSRSEEYRGRRDPGSRSPVRICGHVAERVVLEQDESRATPAFLEDGRVAHGPEQITPATTEVRLELEQRGLPFWISWTVRRELRTRHRAVEEAFFRSVQCTAGPMLGAPVARHGVAIPFMRDLPVEEAAPAITRQSVPGADVVISVERARSHRLRRALFLLRVCDRNVDHAIRTVADRTESLVLVAARPRPVRVTWSVPTANRSTWKWLEDAFFASIRCPGR